MDMNMQKVGAWIILALSTEIAAAGSATWNLNPVDNNWITAANWTPETVPYSETDVATFGASNVTDLVMGDAPDGIDSLNIVGDMSSTQARAHTPLQSRLSMTLFLPLSSHFTDVELSTILAWCRTLLPPTRVAQKPQVKSISSTALPAGENVVITNEGGDSMTGDGYDGGFTTWLQFW